jgi:CRP/FNR family cyclic AMP-dependent transcriptional regulator
MTGTTTAVSTAVLRAVPLFASLTDEQLRVIGTMVKRRSASRNSTIMAAGDPTDSLYIVLSGRLKVMMSDADGREVILTIIGPGEFFGEMGLIDDSPRSASVVAIEPCELLSITKRDFKQSMEQIGSLALLDVFGRVAHLLIDLSETVDGQRVVTRRIAKQDIAKMIGASREMVSRVMKDLQEGGFIEVRGNRIVIHDEVVLPE